MLIHIADIFSQHHRKCSGSVIQCNSLQTAARGKSKKVDDGEASRMTSDVEGQTAGGKYRFGTIDVAHYAKWVGLHECPKKQLRMKEPACA